MLGHRSHIADPPLSGVEEGRLHGGHVHRQAKGQQLEEDNA